MRKAGILIGVLMLFLSFSAAAEELVLYPGMAAENHGFSLRDDQSADNIGTDDYIVFQNVTVPKNTKSVIFTVGCDTHGDNDGDLFQLRQGELGGALLAEKAVDLTPNGKEDKVEFSCSFKGTPGTYDIVLRSLCGRNYVKLWSVRFSSKAYKPEKYVPTPQAEISDLGATTWAAVDGLGRGMPGYADAGEETDKTVGIFYWTWHGTPHGTVYDNDRILKEHPGSDKTYPQEFWGPIGAPHFWGEPLFGYYMGDDRWVLRRHISMLSAAGVDVLITDCTNGAFIWKKVLFPLLEEMHAMREEGLDTPQVAMIHNFSAQSSTKQALYLYYKSGIESGKFSDILFKWKGKPLVMAYPGSLTDTGDPVIDEDLREIREFFTFREPQGDYLAGGKGTQWGWLEMYPQHEYNVQNGVAEQMTVGVAQNHDYFRARLAPMNAEFCANRTYTRAWGEDKAPDAMLYGDNFREQWMRAHEVQPEFVFVTGWNEWTAGFYDEWCSVKNAFPDQYNSKSSRDIEPSKGELKDHYYYQLALNIRRFKGVEKTPVAGREITVKNISDARRATPVFSDVSGDTIHRNHPGRETGVIYTDTTGRNDIVEARVARDKENLYFYVKCKENITHPDDSAWMRLYINTDRVKVTGWEGYDFMIDGGKLYAFSDTEFVPETVKDIKLTQQGKEMYYTVSRADLGVGEIIDLEFKWTDNTIADGDVLDWYVSGDSAPLGRFNYVYTQKEDKALNKKEREALKGVLAAKADTSVVYIHGGRRVYVDQDPRITAFCENDVLYIPADILPDYLNCKIDFEPLKQQLVIMGQDKTLRLIENKNIMYADGKAVDTSSSVIIKDGICFVSVKALSEGFAIELSEKDGICFLGTPKKNVSALDFVY